MLQQAEIALLAGVAGFYLYDVLQMLYSDEVLLVQDRRGWRATLGSDATLGGRYPALPALLSPSARMLRARWGEHVPAPAHAPPLQARLARAASLRWPARLMSMLLFVALPLALLLEVTTHALVVLLAAIYATSIGAVAYIVHHRRALGLAPRTLAPIALDVIACPPFAINVVRMLTLRMAPDAPPEAFAARVLDRDACGPLFAHARRRLELAGLDAAPLTAPVEPNPHGVPSP